MPRSPRRDQQQPPSDDGLSVRWLVIITIALMAGFPTYAVGGPATAIATTVAIAGGLHALVSRDHRE